MAEDPRDKAKKTGPKVIVTQKHKSSYPEGLPDEITPKPTQHVAQNPIDSGENPAKYVSPSTRIDQDVLQQIKPPPQKAKEAPITAQAPIEKTIEVHKSSGPAWLALFLALVSVTVVGGGAYFGLQGYQQLLALNAEVKAKEDSQRQIATQLQAKIADVEKQQAAHAQEVESFQALKRDVQSTQTNMLRLSGDTHWLLSEAYYLSSLATQRLQATKDIGTATAQLESALEKVRQIGDNQLYSVESVLERDIQRLQSAKQVDSLGIWQRLDTVSKMFPNLQINQLQAQQSSDSDAAQQNDDWQQALKSSWQEFKSLVKVTRFDKESLVPILDASSQQQILQLMGLVVEQAKWAVLNNEQAVYDKSLAQLSGLIEQYFIQESEATVILNKIVELKNENIEQVVPDISGSRFALQEAVASISQRGAGTTDEQTP